MITPRFQLSQDERSVTITIRAPYCCLRELEVAVEGDTFLFLCKPYYLRLQLPGRLADDDNPRSCFDSDTGEFNFRCDKANPGEHFKDLEFITKFLVKKVEASYDDGKKIIVLDSQTNSEKTQPTAEGKDVSEGFGFALQSNKGFVSVSSEFNEVFEIDPCDVNLTDRRKLRLQYEQGKFSAEHYMADFVEDEEISDMLSEKAPWDELNASLIKFTDEELDFLKDLPNVEYNLTDQQVNYVFNGLIDILYAYCYDKRTTFNEGSTESGWTIVKLSATLCWLEAFETPKETMISAFRRSVTYPLCRNYKLSMKVLDDLKNLIKLGEQYIIKCFIEIYHIFLGGDCCRYILNNLFVKDYITYAMKWDKGRWKKYCEEFLVVSPKKEELGLNLNEIERGYSLEEMANLRIADSDSDDSSEDSSEDSDSDSSDSSETDGDYPSSKDIFRFLC